MLHVKNEDSGKPQDEMHSLTENFLYINNISMVFKGKLRKKENDKTTCAYWLERNTQSN
jgi:hypothetical protein